MLVLHGSWMPPQRKREARFVLWAELVEGRPRRGGAAASLDPHRARRHPFAAPADRLRVACTAAGIHAAVLAESMPVLVRLPSARGAPLPSPAAAPIGTGARPRATTGASGRDQDADRPATPDGDAPVLAPWRVDALALDTPAAIGSLPALAAEAVPEGVALGDDLLFWAAVARLALELLYRQRVLPTLRKEGRRFVARWRPLIQDWSEIERFGALVRSMPPACRALALRAADPTPRPAQLIQDFLAVAVDHVARTATASVPSKPKYGYGYYAGEVWLQALAGDPHVDGWRYYLDELHQQFADPDEPAARAPAGAGRFRLCFRLEPPCDPAGAPDAPPRWTLRYLLQSVEDPSLLVPATDVWRHTGETARFLDQTFDRPQENLLTGLARAATVYPPLQASMRESRPEACRLTVPEAYDFLRDKALRLRAAGFGVLVPGLETSLNLRLRLGHRSKAPAADGPSMFGVDTLVNFDWQLALGGEAITREEFESLVKLKEPLVQVRGQWVELRPDLVEKALAFFQRQSDAGEMSMAQALRLALAPDGDDGLAIEAVETAGWFDDLLRRLSDGAEREAVEQPAAFVGALRHYQQVGVSWLATLRKYHLGACLADDMGLGKTPTMIALWLHAKEQGTKDGPSLLICPTSVVGNWRHELHRFAPSLTVLVHHGAGRNRAGFAEEARRHDVVISTYALMHRDEAALASVDWSDVVLDETQNIKNPSTKAAQTARKLHAGWRAAMTGTPVENRLSDLWSIFHFLNPGYLGSGEDFRKRFVSRIERARDPEATARLRALVSPFVLRRVKTDRDIIADLPEKNEMKVFCTLTKEQATLYQAVVQDSLRRIEAAEGFARRGEILAALTRLKQVCNHPAQFLKDGSRLGGRSGKLNRLTEMLEEVVAVDDRALVFTQFAEMGTLLKQHLEAALGGEVLFLYGATPALERDRMVQTFQSDADGPRVFVLSIKAGGTGLNLTRANHVFHFDRWWNPAVENQATDRAFRIGQRRDVQVHKFICAGTLEETIDQLIERKVELAEAIVGTNESWITEMTTEQLRDLFTLRADEIGDD